MQISASLIITFIRFFSNTKIMEIAQNTGFIKRKRGILPDTVIKVFVFKLATVLSPSLKQIASMCEEIQPGLTISKNAIYKRLPAASLFLQKVFAETMKISLRRAMPAKAADILSSFKDVKICDSTTITLPDKLADIWPGIGGKNAKSSVKIQGVYSLVSSCFSSLELTRSPGVDTTYSSKLLKLVNKGELLLTDLGYFYKDFFRKISSKGAYFLSRIRTNAVIYQKEDGQMNLVNLLQLLTGKSVIDMDVFVGVSYQLQLKCRLIAIRLPDEVVNERRRKANKKAKAYGKQLSKEETELLAFNLIITNVDRSIISAEAACDLYRARWQVELVFKACKSYLKLDKVGLCGRYQLECLIYGRLTAVVAALLIYNIVYIDVCKRYKRSVSLLLFVKLLADSFNVISENMQLTVKSINKIESIIRRISKHSLHEKRKKKTTFEILQGYYFAKNNYQVMA